MTLKELYNKARKGPTPGVVFITEVMEVTKKSEITVRRWISGEVVPDALTRSVLAKHFKCAPEDLFPELNK